MDEILKNLLGSELLSEEARTEISTKWSKAVADYKANIREETVVEVRAELAEQWTTERDALVERVDEFVARSLAEELSELKDDIERFRDLEAEYAERLVEEKHKMAEQLNEELNDLVTKLDAFLELRINDELEELREDIEIVKQDHFGRRIFEAFSSEFMRSYVDEDSVAAQLQETERKLARAEARINELNENTEQFVRSAKLDKILAPLSGRKREQMAFVLENVATDRLEEAYDHFVSRVLKEEYVNTSKLNESKVITGDVPAGNDASKPSTDSRAQLKKLAGIN